MVSTPAANAHQTAGRLEGGVALDNEGRLGEGHAVGLKLAPLCRLHITNLQLFEHLQSSQLDESDIIIHRHSHSRKTTD